MSPSPGRIASSAASTPSVTSTVLAPGNFSTTRIRHFSPSAQTASPISGWESSTTVVTSPSVFDVSAVETFERHLGEFVGRRDGLFVEDVEALIGACR